MEDYIYENITLLKTPVGYFYVTDGQKHIPFSVRKNGFDVPYEVYDIKKNGTYEFNTETNYDLVIDLRELRMGITYRIGFSGGKLHFGGSDEHTESLVTTIGKWSVGLGAFDPNDDEKTEQAIKYTGRGKSHIQDPPFFDETKFIRYDVSSTSDGFDFRLLDRSCPYIVFTAAWIENTVYDKDIYEDAIDFWLT